MGQLKLATADVLRYRLEPRSRETVRRHYKKWRLESGLPLRCDNEQCRFHREPLVWNGKPLSLTLDHKSGNSLDNHPDNLRLLCPNCDSQLPTRGGKNIGRVKNPTETGYATSRDNGLLDSRAFAAVAESVADAGPSVSSQAGSQTDS